MSEVPGDPRIPQEFFALNNGKIYSFVFLIFFFGF